MQRPGLILLSMLTVGFLSACSTKFHRDWKKAAAAPADPTHQLSGAWEGTWKSLPSGHHGILRAIATPVSGNTAKTAEYEFRYHATWAKVLSGGYTTLHSARKDGTKYIISGEHDLGKLFGGVYYYDGEATPITFRATYKCNLDNEIFEMGRPVPTAGSVVIPPAGDSASR